jgi:adenylylsulfate kinase-like enzyme
VYCNTPLEICEQRDDSGLYQRARAGELQNVTGIDAPFESPLDADLILDTAATEVQDNITMLTDLLKQRGLLKN